MTRSLVGRIVAIALFTATGCRSERREVSPGPLPEWSLGAPWPAAPVGTVNVYAQLFSVVAVPPPEAQVRTDPRATIDALRSLLLLDLEGWFAIGSVWANGAIGEELDLAFGALDGWGGSLKVRLDPRAGQTTLRLDCSYLGFGSPNESQASVTCDLFVGRCAVLVAPTRLPDRTIVVLVAAE